MGTLANKEGSDRSGGLLAVAYACSAGGMATLVGTPPNALAARFLNDAGLLIGFGEWMSIGLPVSFAMLCTIAAVMHLMVPPEAVNAPPDRSQIEDWSRGERITALSFALAFLGWTLPALLKTVGLPIGVELARALPSGAVAMLASSVLFIFHDDTEENAPVLPWPEAAKIDWGLVFLLVAV